MRRDLTCKQLSLPGWMVGGTDLIIWFATSRRSLIEAAISLIVSRNARLSDIWLGIWDKTFRRVIAFCDIVEYSTRWESSLSSSSSVGAFSCIRKYDSWMLMTNLDSSIRILVKSNKKEGESLSARLNASCRDWKTKSQPITTSYIYRFHGLERLRMYGTNVVEGWAK